MFPKMHAIVPAVAPALLLAVATTSVPVAAETDLPKLDVTADFEGGSCTVVSIDQARRVIRFTPTDHKDRGVVAWWYFKVSGIRPGETITLELTGGSPGYEGWGRPDQATFSVDHKTWNHTAPGEHQKKQTVYRQQIDGAEAWFAWGPPFVPSDAQALVDRLAEQSPEATAVELCRSAGGRPVPALRIEPAGATGDRRYGVFIVARQHAWEVSASWVCRGLMEWVLSDDPRAAAIRGKASFYIVPIMDVDNVANGAGGKGEKPHDHNQDWATDPPHFPAVAAAQREAKAMRDRGRLDFFLDIHGPLRSIRQSFFYVPHPKAISEVRRGDFERFIAATRQEMTGPPELGKPWLSSYGKKKPGRTAAAWGRRETPDHVVSLCLEAAFNTPHGTVDGYLTSGRQLGQAIELYLRTDPHTPPPAD